MFGSSVLDVAIGVVFIYLVLSMICTTINEGFATIVNKRGANLFEGIKNLLNDPAFTGLAQQIYSHGLVDGISQNAINPSKPNRLPSYMSSKTFALALLDVLGTHGVVAAAQGELLTRAEKADDEYRAEAAKTPRDDAAVQAKKEAADQAKADLVAAETQARTAYEALNAPNVGSAAVKQAKQALEAAGAAVKMFAARQAAIDASDNKKDNQRLKRASDTLEAALVAGRTLAAQVPDQLANFQAAVRRLPDGHTKESLFVLIDKAKREATSLETQVVHLRQEVEGWFNDSMDRIGGWYKRWTQRILLVVAALLVLILNTDTILLVQHLSTEKDLRASILKQAETTKSFDQVPKELNTVGLPLGWSLDDPNDGRRIPFLTAKGAWYLDFGFLLKKLLGLLLTMGAISLGAPFWFDTLSKFMNLRGAGTPPGEKTKSAPQSQAA